MRQIRAAFFFLFLFPVLVFGQINMGFGFDGFSKVTVPSASNKSFVSQNTNSVALDSKKFAIGDNNYYVLILSDGSPKGYVRFPLAPHDGPYTVLNNAPGFNYLTVDATIDLSGRWWGIHPTSGKFFSINTTTGVTSDVMNLAVAIPGVELYSGLAYNPVDGLLYLTAVYSLLGGSDYTTALFSIDPDLMQVNQVAMFEHKRMIGLACSNEGEFYSVQGNDLAEKFPLFKLTASGEISEKGLLDAGTLSINPLKYISLEIDNKTNKCYLVANNLLNNNFSELREVNLTDAATTLVHSFGNSDPVIGLVFSSKPFIITSPDLGNSIDANSEFTIEWKANSLFNFKLDLSTDGGLSWSEVEQSICSTNTGYTWSVPNVVSSNCILRGTSLTDPTLIATSKVFSIYMPFRFISGNGGENWLTNSNQLISWYQNVHYDRSAVNDKPVSRNVWGSQRVNIECQISNSQWNPLVSDIESNNGVINSCYVNLPDVPTNELRLRITGLVQIYEDEIVSKGAKTMRPYVGMSEKYISLYQQPATSGKYVITSPNGGEKLKGGEFKTITWSKRGIVLGAFYLQLSTDAGLTWKKIKNNAILGKMKEEWIVPLVNSDKCLVRMIHNVTGFEFDRSDRYFSIQSSTEALNYPNPFNPSTTIVFSVEKNAFTSLKVYNSIGQQVVDLVNGQLEAGMHKFTFNASNLPSGVYYYNLRVGEKSETHKMLLMK